jgi:hypothetical protein
MLDRDTERDNTEGQGDPYQNSIYHGSRLISAIASLTAWTVISLQRFGIPF